MGVYSSYLSRCLVAAAAVTAVFASSAWWSFPRVQHKSYLCCLSCSDVPCFVSVGVPTLGGTCVVVCPSFAHGGSAGGEGRIE